MPAFLDLFPDLFAAATPSAAGPPTRAPVHPAAALVRNPALPLPEQLHPALWRAHQIGHQRQPTVASGFAELDAELPGGGWPAGALTELLLPHSGIGEIRLLAPALAAVQQAGRGLMLFDPPAALCGWTLAALGLDLAHLVLVLPQHRPVQIQPQHRPVQIQPQHRPGTGTGTGTHTDMLWALEQALKSGHVGAVMAWLPPRLRPDALRRLQLAAQAHAGPAFLLRDLQAQARPSAAPLRLLLAPAGPDELLLHIVKRRGPPLAQPLRLPLAAVLSAPARARALRSVALPAGVAAAPTQAAAADHD